MRNVKDVLNATSRNNFSENISDNYEAPNDDIEKQISEIWANALNLNRVGISDDFFEIGGTSLQAAIVIAEIYSVWGVKLLIKQLFETPTVRGISELLKGSLDAGSEQDKTSQKIKSKRAVLDEEDAYEI